MQGYLSGCRENFRILPNERTFSGGGVG
jgi:hypothetical protein